ncbi:hypothetical protein [Breznakiella homolactica]|uniref:Uncharacterized protein n=1 Tax=Breznakiella homolactica TaxID=2798577 RepID=A0A7T7XL14_9SPIR|nr:hypothetical protein [Breznakiella homolactica]QQO08326.1 hypothetical protein JFL75_15515 [Breznakiella homolactica]
MKFKSIFIIFNIIILIFLVIVFLMPYFVLGPDFAQSFWHSSWPMIAVLLLILIGLNIFYFINKKLFYLLEREDWPALVQYLEGKILRDGHYSSRLVKLLANTYMVLSDPVSVLSLENKLSVAKPSLVEANALIFGVARILNKDSSGAALFFSQHLGSAGKDESDWIRWYRGFSQLLNQEYGHAADDFVHLVREGREPLVIGLSAYFLSETLKKTLPARADECINTARDGRERVRKHFSSPSAWNKEVSKMQSEIYVAVISKYVSQAGIWLYS